MLLSPRELLAAKSDLSERIDIPLEALDSSKGIFRLDLSMVTSEGGAEGGRRKGQCVARRYNASPLRAWRNWQTRKIQVLVG